MLSRAALLVLLPSAAFCQLLFEPGEEYENYGREDYKRYGKSIFYRILNPVYDEMGDFVTNGVEIFSLRETHTVYPRPGSRVWKGEYFYKYVNGLVVSHNILGRKYMSIAVGDNIRTKFTPLSLDMANLNGIRCDLDTGPDKFTLVTSRVDRPIFNLDDSKTHNKEIHLPRYATYLLGGHWERRIGTLTVGGTYVNQFRVDSMVGTERNSLKGTLPKDGYPVAYLVLKLADGSEQRKGGARIYDVEIYMDGKRREVPVLVTQHDAKVIDLEYPNGDRGFPKPIPPYVQFIRGDLPTKPFGTFQAEGSKYVLYWFEMPEDLGCRSVEFRVVVSGDYLLSLSEVYVANPLAPKTDPLRRYGATYFYEVAGAKGSPENYNDVEVVRFNYGRQTSNTVAGLHLRLDSKELFVNAEYKRRFDFRQFLNGSGEHFLSTADAFYVNFKRYSRKFSFGGELFYISPFYSTMISVNDLSYATSYLRSIDSPFTDAEMFLKNNTLEFDTVDDNDDKDRFPDKYFLLKKADNNGVFPGQDEDMDGRPDVNENENDIPDYLEPFLLYDVNPQEFDYGDDMNNNGIIDIREDDDKPDYPYDVDSKGYNIFLELEPTEGLKLTLGHYDVRQILAGGRNVVSYLKLDYSKYLPFLADIHLVNFSKRVRDDIKDDVFQFQQGIPSSFNPDPRSRFGVTNIRTVLVEDRLLMKDSFVNTSYMKVRFLGVKGLNFEQSLKVELNRQFLGRSKNDIWRWAYVLKGDYTYRFGRLSISPKFKYMAYRVHDRKDAVVHAHEAYFFPILRVDYTLTPRTKIKFGAQGFPFLKGTYRDFINRFRDYTSQDYIIMLSNISTYRGYELSFNVGYEVRKQMYKDRRRAFEDVDYGFFFLRFIVGVKEI